MINIKIIVLVNKNNGLKGKKISCCKTQRIVNFSFEKIKLIKAYFEVLVEILLELLGLQEI